MGSRGRVAWGAVAMAVMTGCAALRPVGGPPTSLGSPSSGALWRGTALANSGRGFVRARTEDPTRFASASLARALERAAASVATAFPGSAPLKVGDASSPGGGSHPRHRSHRAGRDVDVLFYVVDADGRPLPASGFVAVDRFGVATAPAGAPSSGPVFLDLARNWHFVRTLLTDPEAPVQWIFCSEGVKAQLLRYAAAVEDDPAVLTAATWVLHQPSNGRAHDDHFHVRVLCADEEVARGCENGAPHWPWHRDAEKADRFPGVLDDGELVGALLEGYTPDLPPPG